MSEGLRVDGVSLPGLRGDRAVGFMAALGVLRLLTEERGHPAVTLAWTPDHSTAVIGGGPWETPQDIADELLPVVEGIPEGGVLPGVPVEWPPGRAKRGPDPALPLRRDAREAWRELLG
uniref:type I-G CRISPR-associated protein, Cas3-extension family n=1 Tax=Salinispora arenicola TaxID=168697 RepID=UPI003FA6DD00